MTIIINKKEMTPLAASKSIFASVIEDVNNNFEEYARMFIKDYDDLNEEELRTLFEKRHKVYDILNDSIGKDKLV